MIKFHFSHKMLLASEGCRSVLNATSGMLQGFCISLLFRLWIASLLIFAFMQETEAGERNILRFEQFERIAEESERENRMTWNYEEDRGPYPGTAALFSAVLPGLGQAYNDKYWKIPLIYLAGGGLYYGFSENHSMFTDLREAYRIRTDESIEELDDFHPDANSGRPTYASLRELVSAREHYRRNRDLFFIGIAAVYVLNVVDAYVDAHLYAFDLSDDLSMHWQINPPSVLRNDSQYGTSSLSLYFNF